MEREKRIEDVDLDAIQAEMKEPEEIDRRVEALMIPEEGGGSGKEKKKRKRNKGEDGYLEKQDLIKRIKGWSRRHEIITAVVIMITAVLVSSRLGGSSKDTGVVVDVLPLSEQSIQEKLSLSDPVPGTDSVDVVSNIHTEITAMSAKEGDQVHKDQVLAVLGSTDLEWEVRVAQNVYDLVVNNGQEEDKEAALGYEKAVQDFQKTGMDHSRNSQLLVTGGISQMGLEVSTSALNDAKRTTDDYTVVNGEGVADKSYELRVEDARYDLERKMEELESTQIKSAIDGTVVRINSKMSQSTDKVEDDKPILSIENLGQLEPKIKVNEFSIGKVKVGQPAMISADILDGSMVNGEMIKISPTGEKKKGGSTEQVIPAIIRVGGQDIKLIAGTTAKAELLVKESEDVFVAPTTALPGDGNTTHITTVQDLKVKHISVTISMGGDVLVEVMPTDDTVLEEDMQVIQNPNPMMVDGTDVIVCPQQQKASNENKRNRTGLSGGIYPGIYI